ncbi:MAG: EpsI family protein [Rubrivivax sp.]|nr:EpsI family protein [Rubrivivax sp.]
MRASLLALVMMGASALAVMITPRTYMADQHPREKLAEIVPKSFGEWEVDRSIVPLTPSPDLQEVIDATYDETLSVTYRNREGQRVMLSLAYGRNQHKGMNTHRPEVCYPAQGFSLVRSSRLVKLQFGAHTIDATQVVAAMGGRNEPITYWLLVGDEVTQFGYPQRFIAISYGLKGLIPDGVLVRVSSIGVDNAAGFALQERFISAMLTAVGSARLPRLLGRP